MNSRYLVNASELEIPRVKFSYNLEVHPGELSSEIGKGSSGYVQSILWLLTGLAKVSRVFLWSLTNTLSSS